MKRNRKLTAWVAFTAMGAALVTAAQYLGGLSSIGSQLREVERTLVPAMRAWSGGEAGRFHPN